MKTFLRLGLITFLGVVPLSNQGADLSLPITQGADLAVIDPGNGEGPHFIHRMFVSNASTPPEEYYSVGFTLITTSYGRPLRASASRIDFLLGEEVSPASQDYLTQGSGNWIPIQSIDEGRDFPGADWRYIDKTAGRGQFLANGRTEFFIGFRFTGDEGQHYGWMRFNRPDTHFLTFFQLTAWDYNPLPGEPIAAGLPPAIPLTSQVTVEGMLHLVWPAAVNGWILEASDTLGPGAVWEPVADVAGHEALLSPPDGTRFYRLRKP